jgi:hypothetical protein
VQCLACVLEGVGVVCKSSVPRYGPVYLGPVTGQYLGLAAGPYLGPAMGSYLGPATGPYLGLVLYSLDRVLVYHVTESGVRVCAL